MKGEKQKRILFQFISVWSYSFSLHFRLLRSSSRRNNQNRYSTCNMPLSRDRFWCKCVYCFRDRWVCRTAWCWKEPELWVICDNAYLNLQFWSHFLNCFMCTKYGSELCESFYVKYDTLPFNILVSLYIREWMATTGIRLRFNHIICFDSIVQSWYCIIFPDLSLLSHTPFFLYICIRT